MAQSAATVTQIRGGLTPFEGREVVGSQIEIPDAAGGLREALDVEKIELAQGSKVYVLLECDVEDIKFPPIMEKDKETGQRIDTGQDTRVHKLRTKLATIVDAQFATEHIEKQRDRNKRARDARANIRSLDDAADEAAAEEAENGGDDE